MIYNINALHPGVKIIQDNEPCIVISNEFIKPGKCQSFNRIKLRKLISGKILDRTFKYNDCVIAADVMDLNVVYLYNDAKLWYFMCLKSFELFDVNHQVIGNCFKWLSNQIHCTLTMWNKEPINVILPPFVELLVSCTMLENKGNTVGSGCKLATLNTGAVIKVPLFIKTGAIIKVSTKSGEYVARIK